MCFTYTNAVKKVTVGNPTAKSILFQLADCSRANGYSYPSIQYLSNITEFSERAIKSAISLLEKKGFIHVIRQKGKGNKYYILIKIDNTVLKKTSETNVLPSEFSALASEIDTPKLVQEMPNNHYKNNYKNIKNHHKSNKAKKFMNDIDLNYFNSDESGE